MKGVILCAGKGTRLRPKTYFKPKPLVEVDNTPLVEYSLEYGIDTGVTEFHLVVGYKQHQIKNHIGDSYQGIPVEYHTQETPEGLAHAVAQVDTDIESHFLLLLSDVIYGEFPSDSLETDSMSIMTDTVPLTEASEYGVCKVNSNGDITGLVEKPESPPSNKILAGSYVLPPEIMEYCETIEPSDRGEYEITDAINLYIEESNVECSFVDIDSWSMDVARPEDVTKTDQQLKCIPA